MKVLLRISVCLSSITLYGSYTQSTLYHTFPLSIQEELECSICLEPLKKKKTFALHQSSTTNSEKNILINVPHIFHADCLKQWIKKEPICPLDRRQLTQKEKRKLKGYTLLCF